MSTKYSDQFLAQSEMRKLLFKRLQKEGITLPFPTYTAVLEGKPLPACEFVPQRIPAGRALDLACGSGRHALWLARRGWEVTAVDQAIQPMPGITCIQADLAAHEYRVEPEAWDLIVCWLYWQPDLLPEIAAGVRKGGVAGAGRESNRPVCHFPGKLPGGVSGLDRISCRRGRVQGLLYRPARMKPVPVPQRNRRTRSRICGASFA